MLFLTFGPNSLSVVVTPLSLTKYMQTEQLLCWSGMADTEHTTSGSNVEAVFTRMIFNILLTFFVRIISTVVRVIAHS